MKKIFMNSLSGSCLRVLVACYSHTGNTLAVARMIRDRTCGVLFGVEPVEGYEAATVEAVSRWELEENLLPELRFSVPCMCNYDLVLIGGPVWHDTIPAPLRSFLGQTDFYGRRVVPFCTHERGPAGFFAEFAKRARNAVLLPGFDIDVTRYHFIAESAVSLDASLAGIGIPNLRCVGM